MSSDGVRRNSSDRISRLEQQVESLKAVVRELADCLQEELCGVDERIARVADAQTELASAQQHQAKLIKRQEDRLRRGLQVMADALSALDHGNS